ncbi:T9SS type B sorting domain-containing protein [Christiangramia aquimixticola]|uniref:T9SS type B sorting domain-containing protein n=1 Tax=Christiangramia aquimixticola TaxID=1697558 RepID=UPI003AA7C758
MKKILSLLIFLLISLGNTVNAQGSRCADIEPFCAGSERLTFPNSNSSNSDQVSGEFGPDYGCLEEQPYPAWFFLQIEDSGNLRFRISQNSNRNGTGAPLDVDFVVWGPFQRNDDYCNVQSLSSSKIVDCSYLTASVETMTIPQAKENEIYVVVITNFEQIPGFISLEQTNEGQGSTDCSILEFDLGENVSVCGESEYILDGESDAGATYQWYEYDEATSNYRVLSGETGPTLRVTSDGKFRLVVTDPVEGKSEQDEVEVTFYDKPAIGKAVDLARCNVEENTVDLTQTEENFIAPNANAGSYEVEYFENETSVEEGVPITNPETFPFVEGKKIFAQVVDQVSGCRSSLVNFSLKTFDFPNYALPDPVIFCVDLEGVLLGPVTVGSDLGAGFEYEWLIDGVVAGTNAEISIDQFPAEDIVLNISHPVSGCEIEYRATPVKVSRPEIVNYEISGSDFGDGYKVTVIPENGIGTEFAQYEYSLDNGAWKPDSVFKNVPAGNHIVRVREINGCGSTQSKSFFLVGFPRFFTPNGDGFNDYWKLIIDSSITVKSVLIFDRYGKLIANVDPNNFRGWDGKMGGRDMPAADYWFRVVFKNETTGELNEYKANFSLVR